MDFKSVSDVSCFFNGNDKLVVLEKLQELCLLKKDLRCKIGNCRRKCVLRSTDSDSLGYIFFCKNCKKKYSVRTHSFFENIKLTIENVFLLLFSWCALCPVNVASSMHNIRRNSVVQMYRFFRDIASWKLLESPNLLKVGGVGHVVQIDESVVTRRKNNVGRIVREQWVLGMYDTTSKKGLFYT